jgi:hypothetical protein
VILTSADAQETLEGARQVVERRVQPDGLFDGWDGRDVLCHLAAYARVVAAVLRSTAENRPPSSIELYGRELSEEESSLTDLDAINEAIHHESSALGYADALRLWRDMHAQVVAAVATLTDEQLAAPGPTAPANWWRPHLGEVVTTLTDHYAAHMAAERPAELRELRDAQQ